MRLEGRSAMRTETVDYHPAASPGKRAMMGNSDAGDSACGLRKSSVPSFGFEYTGLKCGFWGLTAVPNAPDTGWWNSAAMTCWRRSVTAESDYRGKSRS